ncbi:mitochondrial carrier domain-containing protein [Earliella scabrosa]|nr:mitochondrial carrier domain-containing protein [Earliella scabrosa]
MSADSTSTVKDTQSLSYIVRSGAAGGIAGCVAKTVVAPLDRVKILFQASNPDFHKYAGTWSGALRATAQIYSENGVRGLLQGHSATLLRIFPYAAINYMAYDQFEALLMPTRETQTNARRFIAGAASGVLSVFLTYPLDLIRVRMAYSTRHTSDPTHRPSFLSAVRTIYTEGLSSSSSTAPGSTSHQLFARFPILKFYRGFTVSVAGMIPYAGTSFLVWGFLHSKVLPPKSSSSAPRQRKPLLDLGFGAVAGLLAQTVSYPFEVVRRRMQVGGLTSPDRWLRWSDTVRVVWETRGWRGFYVGLTIGYLKVVPMKSVSFAVWQALRPVMGT